MTRWLHDASCSGKASQLVATVGNTARGQNRTEKTRYWLKGLFMFQEITGKNQGLLHMRPVYCEGRTPEARHVAAAALCSQSSYCPPHLFLATSQAKLYILNIYIYMFFIEHNCFKMNQCNYRQQFIVSLLVTK